MDEQLALAALRRSTVSLTPSRFSPLLPQEIADFWTSLSSRPGRFYFYSVNRDIVRFFIYVATLVGHAGQRVDQSRSQLNILVRTPCLDCFSIDYPCSQLREGMLHDLFLSRSLTCCNTLEHPQSRREVQS
jgi:hypothetical protein